ncbi:Protein of unknown function [Desulfatibacillum alkenivorans DSM 16219]|jgi:hypothetical protein|uniref:DUF3795 domain-containing protein n=1 Tax=Desulfatibacillum alkenivorans DSM 16219 TaxID=1121393 RepID=A0A1M6WSG1_9BACT|nr:DUF3795 domain-containing protein [Desulfatibacillum alkenivorans]SHK96465.1 Protein of unknown function [Desulfatibacillum alkenivorans DSM 16219]
MEEMIAYCGLDCAQCPSYIATKKDDDVIRAKAAAFLNKTYGFDLTPEQVNCDGCLPKEGRKLGYCATCEVRACGEEKGLENCAHCSDAPCGKLEAFHNFSKFAKDNFDRVLQKLQS